VGRKRFDEVLNAVLEALETFKDENFTITQLAREANIKFETAKKVLEFIEKITNSGMLHRVNDNPRIYRWVPHLDVFDVIVTKAFRILLDRERLSVDDIKRFLGLDERTAYRILETLVNEELARWIDEDAVGLLPLKHYLKLKIEKTIPIA